jgi:hypothetical protein
MSSLGWCVSKAGVNPSNKERILNWAKNTTDLRLLTQVQRDDGMYSCSVGERVSGYNKSRGGWFTLQTSYNTSRQDRNNVQIVVHSGLDLDGFGIITRTDTFEIGTHDVYTLANDVLKVLNEAGLPKQMLHHVCSGVAHIWPACLASKSLSYCLPILPPVLFPIITTFLFH